MTKLVFETATLADAIKKAAGVAPAKGAAFDKAAGIVIDIDPNSDSPVMFRATDTKIFYSEIVDAISVEGDAPVAWRLPSERIAGLCGALPIGSGKQVTMEQKDNKIIITQGRIKATLQLIYGDYYPTWDLFDPSDLQPVSALGARIKQVQWAAAKSDPRAVFTGVHMDGDFLVATDTLQIGIAECQIPLKVPITVEASVLATVVKNMGDTMVGTSGNMLLLMPDEHTQIQAVILADEYINYKRVTERDTSSYEEVKLSKAALLELVKLALTYQGGERFPTLRVFIGEEEISCVMSEAGVGTVGDVLEVPGQCVHDRVEIKFTPRMLQNALEASPNDDITIRYLPDPHKTMFIVDGGSGYKAWVMPRRPEMPSD